MVTWKDFATAEPGPADVGRPLLFQFNVGLAFLAMVRKDGAPRLHPVCPVLSQDRRLMNRSAEKYLGPIDPPDQRATIRLPYGIGK